MKIRLIILLASLVLISGTIDVTNFLNYSNIPIPSYIEATNKDNTPNDNHITNAGATLGRVLFYDKNLSSNNTIACASCHKQALAFSDDATVSVGLNGGLTGRHSMRLAYARFAREERFFWDERATSLEDQTTQPIQDHVEMGFDGTNGADIDSLIRKLSNLEHYQRLFPLAFSDGTITEDKIQKALGQFIRSIQSFDSKFDIGRQQVANDTLDFPNFTTQENLGKSLFLHTRRDGGAACGTCHRSPTFDISTTAGNNGIISVAGNPTAKDLSNTRAPSLRDVFSPNGTLNGPMMHDGSFTDMLSVINHYNSIPVDPDNTNIDNALVRGNGSGQRLNLTEAEKEAVVAFLKTLTSSAIYTDEKWSDPFDTMGDIEVKEAPPNFVVVLVDDMGWTGSSVAMSNTRSDTKSGYYFTPKIEELAQEGMTFSQAYAPAPKCSPSRCAILTGQTTARNQFTETGGGGATTNERLLPAATNTAIDVNDVTIGEWLKDAAGYRTAHYGKWHLQSGGTSTNGFDFGDGATTNNDGDQGGTVQTDPKKIFELSTKAVDFITAAKNDNVPFYLQVSHYAVHGPSEAKSESIDLYNNLTIRPNNSNGNHNREEYGAMTEDMDTGTGQILQAIKDLGLEGDTYVIFTSDNGASAGQSSNAPLQGGKVLLTEGGIRVPFIIKGPNIPAGTYNNTPIVGYDLFPTFAALTNSSSPLPADLDGENIAPLFLNNSIIRTEPLYFHSPHYGNNIKVPVSAAVDGDFKLKIDYDTGLFALYDLSNDIGETTDVQNDNPAIFNKLRVQLRNHLKNVAANMPTLNATHADWASTVQPEDADGDGLNDVWEFTNLLTHLEDGNGDPDGDGKTNLEEQIGNTDPLVAEGTFDCQTDYVLDGQVINMDQVIPATNTIESSAIYTSGSITYTAGNSILLKPGFAVEATAEFSATIENCTPTSNILEESLTPTALKWNEVNSINNKERELRLSILPNPTTGQFSVELANRNTETFIQNIQILDMTGALIFESSSYESSIDLSSFSEGVYIIRAQVEGQFITEKVVLNR